MESLQATKTRTDVEAVIAVLEGLKKTSDNNLNPDLIEYSTGYSLGLEHAIETIKIIR